MNSYCPGAQKYRQPQPEGVKCPYCKEEAEIWTDEFRIICPGCKNVLVRRKGAVCLEWCREAEVCIGRDKLARYFKEKEGREI